MVRNNMKDVNEYLNSIIKGDSINEGKFFKDFLKKKMTSIFNEQAVSVDFSHTVLNLIDNNPKYSSQFRALWTNNALTEAYLDFVTKIIKEDDDMADCEEAEVTKAAEDLEIEGKKRKTKAKKKIVEDMSDLRKKKDVTYEVETEDSRGNERSWTIVAKTDSEAEKEAATKHRKQFKTSAKTKIVGRK
jgi:hypothetical protein